AKMRSRRLEIGSAATYNLAYIVLGSGSGRQGNQDRVPQRRDRALSHEYIGKKGNDTKHQASFPTTCHLAAQLPSYPATQLPSYPATQLPSYLVKVPTCWYAQQHQSAGWCRGVLVIHVIPNAMTRRGDQVPSMRLSCRRLPTYPTTATMYRSSLDNTTQYRTSLLTYVLPYLLTYLPTYLLTWHGTATTYKDQDQNQDQDTEVGGGGGGASERLDMATVNFAAEPGLLSFNMRKEKRPNRASAMAGIPKPDLDKYVHVSATAST
ncbi:hypothetical protein CIB48_g7508, partial [Xylaria polymorpha]